MEIIVLNPYGPSKVVSKKVEIVKLNGKYYIEMEEFENSDSIVELSIALASENHALKERIAILEEELKFYK
jgi:hypothetical protein